MRKKRNASSHNYRNNSIIVDLAIGQIPRSTERISSYFKFCLLSVLPPVLAIKRS